MKNILLIFSIVLATSLAQASLYFEPYVGMQSGTAEGYAVVNSTTPVRINFDFDVSGTTYGAKLGYSFPIVTFGADYQTGSLTLEDNTSPPDADTESDFTDVGVFISLSLPLVDVNATYFVSSKIEGDNDFEGTGFKAGLTFTFLPFFNLNLDYIQSSYDDGVFPGVTTFNVNADRKTYMASLGIPFRF